MPIVVGGTGFWIYALIYDMNFPEIKAAGSHRDDLIIVTEAAEGKEGGNKARNGGCLDKNDGEKR